MEVGLGFSDCPVPLPALPSTGSSSCCDSLSVRSEILKSDEVSLSKRASPWPEPLSSSPPSSQEEGEVTVAGVTSEGVVLPLSLSK